MERFEVVVCGLGAMGSATAYQLARRGARVLGLDMHAPPHAWGSTHGDTRVTRTAIGEGLAYVPLAQRSHQLWREIEAETGADLLTTSGVLVLASPGAQARHNGKSHFFETTVQAAEAFGIDHEVLTAADIGSRFPQFHLAGNESGYYESGGGFVRPEAAVSAQLELAMRHGAVIRTGEPLTTYTQEADGVTVTTTRGRIGADVLVLATGPWLASILGAEHAHRFAITRQVQHWYAVDGPVEQFAAGTFPVFIWDDGPRSMYGFPALDGVAGGVKVAVENSVPVTSVADVARQVSAVERYEAYDAVIGQRFPGLARHSVRSATCMYTTTPDGDFVIDRHPQHRSVLLISACSGHGFKHSAAIGEAVAVRLTGEDVAVDLSPFALERPG